MGVLGLTPFLQKTCPEVIKHLPDRLRSLSGKRIVIDGTLITQRFHFAQTPHHHRHVLGWYRLIKELNDANVSTICVFDGKERSLAKGPEVERRKEVRRLTMARGLLESDRLTRLRGLSDVLYKFRRLDIIAREQAIELLRQIHPDGGIPLSSVPEPPTAWLQTGDQTGAFTGHFMGANSGLTVDEECEALFSMADQEPLSFPLTTVFNVEGDLLFNTSPSKEFPLEDGWMLELTDEFQDNCVSPHAGEAILPETEPSVEEISSVLRTPSDSSSLDVPSSTVESQKYEDVNATFASLYNDFRRSIPKLASLAIRERSALSPAVSSVLSDPDTQAEIVMTKAQYQLTLDERNLWEQIVSSPSIITDPFEEELSSAVETTLANLTQTSNVMSESYQRRTNPPTAQTYEECRRIIEAMGVPCIDSVGPFEAEALASSMVLNGLADYVASEDTDVLVYDAPLVRNLTNRQSPLTVVSGADVRMVLELDRASFIDFALLLGTDFSQRIKRVGPARALKFIKAHRTIERVVELETKYAPQVPQNLYLAQVEVARMVFQTLPPVPEKSRLEQGDVDETAVAAILQQYGLGKALMNSRYWDYGAALDGNYFDDDPSAF